MGDFGDGLRPFVEGELAGDHEFEGAIDGKNIAFPLGALEAADDHASAFGFFDGCVIGEGNGTWRQGSACAVGAGADEFDEGGAEFGGAVIDFFGVIILAIALAIFVDERGSIGPSEAFGEPIGEILDAAGAEGEGGIDLPAEVGLAAFAVAHVFEGDDDLVEGDAHLRAFFAHEFEVCPVGAFVAAAEHLAIVIPADERGFSVFDEFCDISVVLAANWESVGWEQVEVGDVFGVFLHEVLVDHAEAASPF